MAKDKLRVIVFWFRRDLRLEDNAGLRAALKSGQPVLPLFIFDTGILSKLADVDDRRVDFLHQTLRQMDADLRRMGSGLLVEHGSPIEVWKKLLKRFSISEVVFNHDYEPYAIERDGAIERLLREHGVPCRSFKDQVIFERRDVQKDAGGTYTVFTPYSRKWKSQLRTEMLESQACAPDHSRFLKWPGQPIPSLESLGFRPTGFEFPASVPDRNVLTRYGDQRNTPGIRGTSRLGLHLRFGTVSIRELVRLAREASEVWLNELIWREFFMQILWNHPHVVGQPFRSEYAGIAWREDADQFAAWCEGRTGYPLVDAGMRELNATGFMHNRVRMVAGSFLAKSLLIDWRWGEAYFARRLLDFDLASNNGNWQWVAGCGCDAAPYFRVFNPDLQMKTFDTNLAYVKRWVPEYGTARYMKPIVDHAFARDRAIRVYKEGLAAASRNDQSGASVSTAAPARARAAPVKKKAASTAAKRRPS